MNKQPSDQEILARDIKAGQVVVAAQEAGFAQQEVTERSETMMLLYLTNIQTWLRENYLVHIWIEPSSEPHMNFFAVIRRYIPDDEGSYFSQHDHSQEGFDNYLLALCDGIMRGLEMLKANKNDHEF